MKPKIKFMACALAAVAALAGCSKGGGDASGGGKASGGAIEVVAVDSKFETANVSVPAGEVTVTLVNNGKMPHTFTIKALGVDTGLVNPGEKKTVTFKAPDKATEFVCSIHLASDNMKGTLTPA